MVTSNPLHQTPNPAQDWDLPPSPPKPFDAGWKLILYNHFYLIVQRIFPSLYKTIDTTVPPEFLNTELQKLEPQATIGHLYPDVLVRVKTKIEQDQLLLCHLEVQTKANKTVNNTINKTATSIEERMFRYAIRIYHYFNQMPVGILIMADTSNTFRPTQYRYTEPHTGLTTTYEFLLFKTADWRDRIDQIKESKDLVDQVVYVYLEFQQAQKRQWNMKHFTLKDMNHQKLEFKKRLFTHLVGLGMDQTEIRDVLLFIDWMVILPRNLEEQYYSHKNQLIEQQEGTMAWMSTFERVSRREGRKIGKEEGKEIGKLELAQDYVIKLLSRKFGLTQEESNMIKECHDRSLLETAHEEILFAETKEEILTILEQPKA